MNHTRLQRSLAAFGLALSVSGFLQAGLTQAEQAALTPQTACERLLAGHERFVAGKPQARDWRAEVAASGAGQWPGAVIISCLDSRTSAELLFDQGLGDVFSGRVAGNSLDAAMLGSVEYGVVAAGAPLVIVLGHSGCGAIKGACDQVKLGNLAATLAGIEPALGAVPDDGAPRSSKNPDFVAKVTAAHVRATVGRLGSESALLRSRLQTGTLGVLGGVYDVSTGRIAWLADTAVNVAPPAP